MKNPATRALILATALLATVLLAGPAHADPPIERHCSDQWCKSDTARESLDCEVHPQTMLRAATIPVTARGSGDASCNHTPSESQQTWAQGQRFYGGAWHNQGYSTYSQARSTWLWITDSSACVTGWWRLRMEVVAFDITGDNDRDTAYGPQVWITC